MSPIIKRDIGRGTYTYKDQQNRLQSPEIDPQKYPQLVFNKGARLKGRRIVYSTNDTGVTGYHGGGVSQPKPQKYKI